MAIRATAPSDREVRTCTYNKPDGGIPRDGPLSQHDITAEDGSNKSPEPAQTYTDDNVYHGRSAVPGDNDSVTCLMGILSGSMDAETSANGNDGKDSSSLVSECSVSKDCSSSRETPLKIFLM